VTCTYDLLNYLLPHLLLYRSYLQQIWIWGFYSSPISKNLKKQHSCCIVVVEVIEAVVLFLTDHKWCPAVDSSCGNNNRQQYSVSVPKCCGTDRFHSVCQWRQANSCTCMRYLQILPDTFLLLHMDYCGTSILEHNDMNIDSDYWQNNGNALNNRLTDNCSHVHFRVGYNE